jgi:hypothetical protein
MKIFAAAPAISFITASAAAAGVGLGLYGGAALPVGGLGSSDLGYFNWLSQDNPGSEHDLVDIRGLTLSGADAAPCPAAGVKLLVDVARWLDVEAGAFYQFNRSRHSNAKSAFESAEAEITGALAGVNLKRELGPFRARVGGGAGYYFAKVSLYASGECRSGFVYSRVYTLDKSVAFSAPGGFVSAALSYPLSEKISMDLTSRYHRVANGGTYDVRVHETYGYEPYYEHEYVFDTPLHKAYDDQFVDIAAGLTYRVL